MTIEALKDCKKKILAQMAKDQGIPGWHSMRKDQLIRALSPAPGSKKDNGKLRTMTAKPKAAEATATARRAPSPPPPPAPMAPPRELAHHCTQDRIVTVVRDPYWLHTYWELSRATLGRAQAALGQEWHSARPILRLVDVTSEDTSATSERHVRDIEIHGRVNNWYIDVTVPPRSYRVDIGYLSRRGKFYVLARSNVVTTPKASVTDPVDSPWSHLPSSLAKLDPPSFGDASHGRALELRDLFEERFRRPMSYTSLTSLGLGALSLGKGFHFEIDAELIVYGATEPNARVTLQGEPVQLRPDGSFMVRFNLPDARQIIPAVAVSPDGVEERTIVLAVERNTKELEPMVHDANEI
jgi:hypothetical protein